MKRIKYLLFIVLVSLVGNISVLANTIYSIDVTLKLDSKGNGKITEIWSAKVDHGTEFYRPMGDLGNSKITNFHVVMDDEYEYTFVDKWNPDATIDAKAYKNGFNYTSSGFEMCFGYSSYGKHTYVVTYDVSNMVYNTLDSQFIYWKFVNDSMNPAPLKITVNVISDYEFTNFELGNESTVSSAISKVDSYLTFVKDSITDKTGTYTSDYFNNNSDVYCNSIKVEEGVLKEAHCKVGSNIESYEYYDYIGKVSLGMEYATPVWGYGYRGIAIVEDGLIKMESDTFDSSNYVVLLARFPLNTFNTNNSISRYRTFNDVYGKSQEGSYRYDMEEAFDLFDFIGSVLSIIPFAAVVYAFFKGFNAVSRSGRYTNNIIDAKEVNPFREIPCNKDILDAYLISIVYGLNRKKEDLFGAAILKWVLDGTVTIKEVEKKGLLKTKKEISIDMTKPYHDDTPLGKLHSILLAASKDGILESYELEKYLKNNYDEVYKWFDKAEEYARDKRIASGGLTPEKNGKIFTYTTYKVESKVEEDGKKMIGLKKFLKEVSDIDEKRPIEVNLWEYYLMYAQIFGIAKEVAKSFKDLYPEIADRMESTGFDYPTFMIINDFQSRTTKAMSDARTASYSSGGGGSSFGGGGGGSFGGGSGGGCR